MQKKILFSATIIVFISMVSGCTFIFQTGRRSDVEKIETLSRQLDELSQAKTMLEDKLSQEISDKQVKLQMLERGLVITVLGDVLFDSGKDKLRQECLSILKKISTVLKDTVPNLKVGIEGHTDNEPIKYSSWKSNWELSVARSVSVLHYLQEEALVNPKRLAAIGYGEYQPVAPNDNNEGRQLNRRVEIVILPPANKAKEAKKVKQGVDQGNLK